MQHSVHPSSPKRIEQSPSTRHGPSPFFFRRNSVTKAKTDIDVKIKIIEELSAVEMAGFGRIFNANTPKLRRIVWILILITSIVLSLSQIYNRFLVYYYVSPAVVVKYEKQTSFEVPLITICPPIFPANDKIHNIVPANFTPPKTFDETIRMLRNFFRLLDIMNVEQLWNITDVVPTGLRLRIIEGISVVDGLPSSDDKEDPLQWLKLPTTTGLCTQIYSKRPIRYSGYKTCVLGFQGQDYMDMRNTRVLELLIRLNSSDNDYFTRYFFPWYSVQAAVKERVDIQIGLRELIYVSTRENPCTDEGIASKCLEKCIEDYLFVTEKIQCRLPYMTSDREKQLPWCSTRDEFKDVFESTGRMMGKFLFCNCTRSCVVRNYLIKSASSERISPHLGVNLRVCIPENYVEKVIEYVTYTFDAFLADVGGSLGLYMGICVISLLELIEVVTIGILGPLYNLRPFV